MMHHRMGSYYDPSGSSCPSPIPSMSECGPAYSVASEASSNNNSFHSTNPNGVSTFQNQGIMHQYKAMALRNTTSPTPSKLQPRKGILMSPSYPSQMSPPPPPPTSSIPRNNGNLKNPVVIMGIGSSPARQLVKIDQYYSTQPRPSSKETFVPNRTPGRLVSSQPSQHQLVRGRKVSSRDKMLQQRLKFECEDMRQIHALNKRLASLTIADMSPKLALQRILLLYKRGDHRYT